MGSRENSEQAISKRKEQIDTWKGKENLKNTKEAIEEFKKEYQRDMKDVVKQKCKKGMFKREELLGRFTARKLFR